MVLKTAGQQQPQSEPPLRPAVTSKEWVAAPSRTVSMSKEVTLADCEAAVRQRAEAVCSATMAEESVDKDGVDEEMVRHACVWLGHFGWLVVIYIYILI